MVLAVPRIIRRKLRLACWSPECLHIPTEQKVTLAACPEACWASLVIDAERHSR